LFQNGVTPPRPGQRPPGSGNSGDKDHHQGPSRYPYYDPFYDPYFYNLGYGFNPYYGPFGAEDYYLYGYGPTPYDRSRTGDERWPDARQGNVQLRIEPRDIQVFVDGVLSARDGRATLNLPTGRWRLEFVKPGYRTETVDVEVTQGVSVRVERRLVRLSGDEPSAPNGAVLGETGELHVDVRPDDAIVYLDGRAIGLASDIRSSAALRRMPAGRHRIEVRRPGYATLREVVVVSPVQPAVVRGELAPEKGEGVKG
jgi:PEGA domain